MSLATTEPLASDADMVVHLGPVGWEGLEAYLKMIGDRRGPLIRYRDGNLTLVTPSPLHEHRSDRLDGVVKAIAVELDISCEPTGSTLFKRRDRDQGIEPDESYYIEHEAAVRGNEEKIDLTVSPPPDLAIEVVVTNPAAKSLAICRRLGVPEVWVHDVPRSKMAFLHLDATGQYVEAPTSRAFPFLASSELLPWVQSPGPEPYIQWERRLRAWVRDVLGPRHAAMEGGAEQAHGRPDQN